MFKIPDHIQREQEFINRMLRRDSDIHFLINRILIESQGMINNPYYAPDLQKTGFTKSPINDKLRKYISICLRLRYVQKENELKRALNPRTTNIPDEREALLRDDTFYPSVI